MKQTKHIKIFEDRGRLYTINLVKGKKVYGERLVKDRGIEYREWDIRKSKLGAAIKKNIKQIGFKPGNVILYLGSASGTTVSHVSDIIGLDGLIFAVEFAPRVMRDMMFLCKDRKNIAPILADAHQPQKYEDKMCMVDFVFQDIAQKDQAEIFLKNCELFLKDKGLAMIAVSASHPRRDNHTVSNSCIGYAWPASRDHASTVGSRNMRKRDFDSGHTHANPNIKVIDPGGFQFHQDLTFRRSGRIRRILVFQGMRLVLNLVIEYIRLKTRKVSRIIRTLSHLQNERSIESVELDEVAVYRRIFHILPLIACPHDFVCYERSS